ncbi:Serine/threonine-protein kinase pim-2 [Merluccius polli]|uniref:non-specific serine/threonine protein kinase n=1 Tax=Merluccius polli TaxID=89951 RepID=A0AA47N047_MERPO|nr:Serine/threonine-protein kinase pim-2 [Merluccius polli]
MLWCAKGEPGSEGPGAVVLLLDWFQLDQELILVQERQGSSLISTLTWRARGLGCRSIRGRVVEGILRLHSRGVLHRNIKPENLLIETGSDRPRVRIIDLGCGSSTTGCLQNSAVNF